MHIQQNVVSEKILNVNTRQIELIKIYFKSILNMRENIKIQYPNAAIVTIVQK